MVNSNKILTNNIICNSNRSYEACQKQFKLVDFLFQTRIVLERAKHMILAPLRLARAKRMMLQHTDIKLMR